MNATSPSTPQPTSVRPARVAWFSPFAEGLRSCELSKRLLPALSQQSVELELFCSDEDLEAGAPAILEDIPVSHYLTAQLRHRQQPFDAFVYLIEDDERCAFVDRHLRLAPGIALFFDINLSTLVLSRFRHSTGGTDVNAEIKRAHGERSVPLGDYLVRNWSIEIFDRFLPLGLHAVTHAVHTLTESPSMQRGVAPLLTGSPSELFFTPLFEVSPDDVLAERRMLRRMLEIPEQAYVTGFCGGPGLSGRAPHVLDALKKLGNGRPVLFWLTESEKQHAAARRFVATAADASDRIMLLGPRTSAEFAALHAVPDVWLFPQCDPLRGAPLSFVHAAERRIPFIASEIGFTEALPNDCCLRITPGFGEELALSRAIAACAESGVREALARSLRELCASRSTAMAAAQILRGISHARSPLEKLAVARAQLIDAASSANGGAAQPAVESAARDFSWSGGLFR